MTKKKKIENNPSKEDLSFEETLERLQQIVQQLEEGRIGLGDALSRYEEGVKYLKQCHHMLDRAERRIAILTGMDEKGTPVTEQFDEESMSLEEKADNRSRRRSQRDDTASSGRRKQRPQQQDGDMDVPGGLF